ncbi:lysophospholipid acyltransferase family protein [Pedomonas mirosovicensis]|uniref:lysophospholipid acyltransferase family protein n=1 Tax=Pedomonas mirosovicensis TaxID=2908641 RepID=UPI002168A84F|nr:lysophospholipid acyltransferase family protein [Pedomonas mirosovicensis]MCH8686374.1 1-acyl-sn-glycerol-3-phosphate acyltransferase [Pedomonas mirosovicensis]
MRRLDYLWRLIGTGTSFAVFGLGGMALGSLLFPLVHLVTPDRALAYRRCQRLVRLAFHLFIQVMAGLGVLTYSFEGAARLKGRKGALILANHPSLIDVVFIVSHLPQAVCVVKKSHWHNPFVMGIMRGAGYIPNDDPAQMIDDCVAALSQGENLVLFPEGTRTRPNQPMQLKAGAASIIAATGQPFVPVYISCSPTTLTKEEKWYEIPPRRPHFRLVVGEEVNPSPHMAEDAGRSINKRRVNRFLYQVLEEGLLQMKAG